MIQPVLRRGLRPLLSLVLLLAACGPARTQAAAVSCVSPVDSVRWSPYLYVPQDSAERSFRIVSAAPSLPETFRLEQIVGDYALTVVARGGTQADSIASGTLALRETPPGRIAESFPVYGWSDVDLPRLGRVSMVHSAAQRDAQAPGVQASLNPRDRTLMLVFGNSLRVDGEQVVFSTDAGVMFSVFTADAGGMTGRWSDGGLSTLPTQGHFCARRIDPHP